MKYTSINERVQDIKGNTEEISRFIEEYKPFIASSAGKISGKYLRYGDDDELSIALMAFTESINSYDISKGKFLTFAQGVIRRRLIDYYRKERKHINVISLNEYYYENTDDMDLSTEESIGKFQLDEINEYRKLEIAELDKELKGWDISFSDLVKVSPKHKDTRETCKVIIKHILSKPDLLEFIKNKKYIPVSDLGKSLNLSRKKIDRLRKYIIAMLIIISGDYQYLKEYIRDYIL
ncbi:MAG TPA: RNA polymerase sigma-I factor [Clostridiales bacterium]|nr:RNA polymerase sigma-I factor [Clostridiales bacterium]